MAEKKGKVLCVDDEPNISRALQWLLQKEFEVVTANSGQEALALVRDNDFDVLISDQRMPVMTGVEFLREARKISPRSIRILLTGYSDLQAVLRSVNESEVYRFINKPWNISELPKVVDQAVIIARTQPVEAPAPELTEDMPIRLEGGESVLLIDDDPGMQDVVREAIGDTVAFSYAQNLAEAVGILNEQRVSVIVSETRVGGVDATRLINIMKQKHPAIVAVMISAQSDAETVTGLINEGQIYRFVPKPVRVGYLKLVINSALVKHRRLLATPELAGRYVVNAMADGKLASLISDVEKVAVQAEVRRGRSPVPAGAASSVMAASTPADSGGGLFGRVSAGFKRLFG